MTGPGPRKEEEKQKMSSGTIESVLHEDRLFPPSAEFAKQANISGMAAYQALCDEAHRDFEGFWARQAREQLLWHKPFTKTLDESNPPFFKFFRSQNINWCRCLLFFPIRRCR